MITINNLYNEILEYICFYLDINDIIKFSFINKKINKLITQNDILWKNKFLLINSKFNASFLNMSNNKNYYNLCIEFFEFEKKIKSWKKKNFNIIKNI
jgi:hypothetical protein